MNKLTKLLSVFVIAGALGAGTAALAGCGGEPEHTHTAVKHDAVAATCTADGNSEYYSCDCGKYFSDEACTTEITLDSTKVAATGHTKKYTNKDYTNHGVTCEHDDLTETTEAHKDENGDHTCDVCNAKFFPTGKYCNSRMELELEVKANGKVVIRSEGAEDQECDLSEISAENSATFTAKIENSEVERTLTPTDKGYTVSYGDEEIEFTPYLVEDAEDAEDKHAFVGVYTGELEYKAGANTYKLSKIEINEDGMAKITELKVITGDNTAKPVTKVSDISTAAVKYNKLKVSSFDLVPAKIENGVATEINVFVYRKTVDENEKEVMVTYTAKFTKTEEQPTAVPTTLGLTLEKDEYYSKTMGNQELTFTVSNGLYLYSGLELTLVSGNATDGYLMFYSFNPDPSNINSQTIDMNVLLKLKDQNNTLVLSDPNAADPNDPAASITLALTKFEPTALKTDGTDNTGAKVDVFNNGYAFYKVEKTGWYTFTAGSSDVTLYTAVSADRVVSSMGGINKISAEVSADPIELQAGALIAVDSDKKAVAFKAAYSATQPPKEYTPITGSKYEIASAESGLTFANNKVYSLKATASTPGKYYVSAINTSSLDKGPYVKVGGTKYGYKYVAKDLLNGTWSKYDEMSYSVTLAADDVVNMDVGCDNANFPGDVIVYFETEAEYTARQTAQVTKPTFSGAQLGEYKCGTKVFTFSENSVTYSSDSEPEELTFVKKLGDNMFYTSKDGTTYILKFNADGSLNYNLYGSNFTAKKPGTLAEDFTEAQQGTYTYSYTNNWDEKVTIEIKIKAQSVNVYDDLMFVGKVGEVYEWFGSEGSIYFSFAADGKLTVTKDEINDFEEGYTAEKQAASEFAGFEADQQGTYTGEGSMMGAPVARSLTVTADGVTLNLDGWGPIPLKFVSLTGGVYVWCDPDNTSNTVTFSFDGGKMKVTSDKLTDDEIGPYEATKPQAETFTGFNTDQQGTYAGSGSLEGGRPVARSLTVTADGVVWNDENWGPITLKFVSLTGGVYVWSDPDNTSNTVTFSFDGGKMKVTSDKLTGDEIGPYEATKQ